MNTTIKDVNAPAAPSPEEQHPVIYTDLNNIPLEVKVELLNAYTKIKNSPPKVAGFNDAIRYIIVKGFLDWVDAQMLLLMGKPVEAPKETSKSQFNDAEVEALKALAAKVLDKSTKANQAPIAPKPAPAPRTPSADPINAAEWRKTQETMLEQLSRMDRETPETLRGIV